MASLLLSSGAAALGGALFGPLGGILGRSLGTFAGRLIDQALLGGAHASAEGPRLADLAVMSSTEGAPIPRAYGRVRLSGELIWATQLEEFVSTRTETTGGKGAPQPSTTTV